MKCPECSSEVSEKATSCPECGYPLNSEKDNESEIGEVKGNEDSTSFLFKILTKSIIYKFFIGLGLAFLFLIILVIFIGFVATS